MFAPGRGNEDAESAVVIFADRGDDGRTCDDRTGLLLDARPFDVNRLFHLLVILLARHLPLLGLVILELIERHVGKFEIAVVDSIAPHKMLPDARADEPAAKFPDTR